MRREGQGGNERENGARRRAVNSGAMAAVTTVRGAREASRRAHLLGREFGGEALEDLQLLLLEMARLLATHGGLDAGDRVVALALHLLLLLDLGASLVPARHGRDACRGRGLCRAAIVSHAAAVCAAASKMLAMR